MDVNKYENLKQLYTEFSLGNLGTDINNKFALISLVCYITYNKKLKDPTWSCWSTLYKINQGAIPDNILIGWSIVCEDFLYGCSEFPTFGLQLKEIPKKIKELLLMYCPF